jgi:hypothetical protein
MPRTPARVTQADIARALRAVKAEYGDAEVVFEKDGTVRVVPASIKKAGHGSYNGEIKL